MTRILVIDDQATSRLLMQELLSTTSLDGPVDVKSFGDPVEALSWTEMNAPDLVLTDYSMPRMTGLEFTMRFRQRYPDVPLIVVTGMNDRAIRYKALEAGATDFLTKPVDHTECRARCRNLLTMYHQQKLIKNRAALLEEQVKQATHDILLREQETLLRLAKAGEHRDEETGLHVLRMARFSGLIAEGLGLPEDDCQVIVASAPMHDIGKIGIPDGILLKPGKLDAQERELMQKHTRIGYEILRDSPSVYIRMGAVIARSHHEKFDGNGYPDNLTGDDIPLPARIVAVADVFDALMSVRPYKKAWALQDALQYLIEQKGRHFDPRCVEAFLSQFDKVQRVRNELIDPSPAIVRDAR
jgi:two-component system, response regulator RpfG